MAKAIIITQGQGGFVKSSKNHNDSNNNYHNLTTVLGQLLAVVASLVFGDGFRFFLVEGIRLKIFEAARAFQEAEGDEVKGARATELLNEAVSWLRASIAKWMKTNLVAHFEALLAGAKNSFGVEAPEVVAAFLSLEEFKKAVSGRIDDFPPIVMRAKNFEIEISQIEARINKRKAIFRSAENEVRRAKEQAERVRYYSTQAYLLETMLEEFENSEVNGVQ
ncbi:hypothetical protein IT399_02625 [Candidatus Nomurabacteria bacterium]|nr:hypothetical protein [Candidatus Nomurabacteria bacterium]